MSQSSFDNLLQKYLSGECTEEEEKIVLEWYNQLIKKSELHLSASEKSQIESRIWQSIQADTPANDTTTQTTTKVIPLLPRTWWLRVAAAASILVALLAGIGWYLNQQPNKQSTATIGGTENYRRVMNETKFVKKLLLADSSVVLMQPGASIKYPLAFTGNTREVYLKGSAFFTVSHDPLKHFKVYTNGVLTTEVLGTSFSIVEHTTASTIEVAVVTGKVRVFQQHREARETTNENTNSIILTPNKKVIFNTSTSQFITGLVENPQPLSKLITPDPGEDKDATTHPLVFEDEQLDKVLAVLSKVYGINITTENDKLGLYHFTGNISKYNLYKQLDIICQSTHAVYEINGTQIILKETR